MTTLSNTSYIDTFDKKLKAYDTIFLKKINGQGVLFEEASTIKQIANLGIKAGTNTYSTAQFANFIRNIINFKIKNYDSLDNLDNNMGFVQKIGNVYSFNENVKTNIIETLKVINVYVDILDAYKHCIERETVDSGFASGYNKSIDIKRIEIVSDKTRFYSANGGTMIPANTVLNTGFIRNVKEVDGGEVKTVLYLSIQSFNTGLADNYNYDNIFTKTKLDGKTPAVPASDTAVTIFAYEASQAHASTPSTTLTLTAEKTTYASQKYDSNTADPAKINLSLADRNKALVVLLLKTLFNLDIKFRKQSVYALYYYYKFVQLYSTLIINVSNVMYADVPGESVTPPTPIRIETRNATKYNTYPVSAITITNTGTTAYLISGVANTPTVGIVKAGGETTEPTAPITPLATVPNSGTDSGKVTGITGITSLGTGYMASPAISFTLASGAGAGATAVATIVPIVTDSSDINEQKMGLVATDKTKNIKKLDDIIDDIEAVLTNMITNISKYTSEITTSITINTNTTNDNSATRTTLYKSTDDRVIIKINKSAIYNAINELLQKNDLVNDFTIYDEINRIYYNIIEIKDVGSNNYDIEIDAVFSAADKSGVNVNAPVFQNFDGNVISDKPATTSLVSNTSISPTIVVRFLVIKLKDIDGYKSEYIVNRDAVEILNEKIGSNTNKVAYQQSLYEAQNNKNVFLERQILIYNIIIGIIILILVVINVVKIENHQLVKTISLSCLGIVTLLFVIYFISNITYIETFGDVSQSTNRLYKLTTLTPPGSNRMSTDAHNRLKVNELNTVLGKLNDKFINYFEKLIIMIPSIETKDFYREIKEVVSNDIDNKKYINNTLEYKKSQGNNNIGSLKYELENNKLYINTILISAIIFIGIYNLYINYVTDDKYQALVIFICILIFIVIVSYYIITMNRRVKTVFKNIYWGPENSERF